MVIGIGDAKVIKNGEKQQSRLYGIENAEGFDNFQKELLHCFTPSITKRPMDACAVYFEYGASWVCRAIAGR